MIQLNMATGELISSDSDLELMNQQPPYEGQTAALQPHLFVTPEETTIPIDLAMVDASLFIAGQL